jgi:hypothetical protein
VFNLRALKNLKLENMDDSGDEFYKVASKRCALKMAEKLQFRV